MSQQLRTRLLLAAPGLALAAGAIAVALESPNADRVFGALQSGIGVVLVWGVAVAVRVRYPKRPLGLLLFVLAGAHAAQTLASSPSPLLSSLARASRPVVELLLIWIMLAFPSGRLPDWRARGPVIAGALAILLLWLPMVLLSSRFPIAGPNVVCHSDCPPNALLVWDQPEIAHFFHLAFRAAGSLVLVATAMALFSRFRLATPLLRRALSPVLFASIARVLTLAAFLVSNRFGPALIVTFWLIPLAVALGLLLGRMYMAKALQRLVSGLRTRPDMATLRVVMADALSDPSLSIAYWLPEVDQWVDPGGVVVSLPYPSPVNGRAATIISDAEGRPVAALIHDVALLEVPTLVDAVTSSMVVALESHRIEAELGASRAGTASAVEEERHRIERDLHDGAQQRLIALRIKLSVTTRLLDADPGRARSLVAEMDKDVEAAIAELRAFARGIVPPMLLERGLPGALAEAARMAVIPTRTRLDNVGRGSPASESAVYFCCLEALQNAGKHAGAAASAEVALWREGDFLCFSVCDDGAGLKPIAEMTDGQGLSNMRARMDAVGGQFDFRNRNGSGIVVSGRIPW